MRMTKRTTEPTLEQLQQRWCDHVKATPTGHVPVYLGGTCFAWRIVMRREEIENNFRSWKPEYWPEWVTELLTTTPDEAKADGQS